MDIIGAIKFKIEKISTNEKQKNILSLLYIVYFIILLIVFFNMIFSMIISYIIKLLNTIYRYIVINNNLKFEEINIINFSMINENLLSIVNFIKLCVPILITSIYVKYFEKMKFKIECIYIFISIVLTMFLFLDITTICVISLLFFLFILIIPINSGKYFNIIKNIRYFISIYKDSGIKIDKNIILKVIGKALLVAIICWMLSYLTSSFISIYLVFLIYITFFMRVYIGINSNDKILDIFIKIMFYTMVIILYVLFNGELSNKIDKLVGLFITIYFSWDRLFSISKDIEQLIVDKSVLLYYEDDNISEKNIRKKFMNFNFIDRKIDETSLVIQILIRFNIIFYKDIIDQKQFKNELYELCNLYKELKYKSYILIVEYINILNNEDLVYEKEIESLFNDINIAIPQKYFL